MAAFLNLDQSLAVDNGYDNRFITPFSFHHQNSMMPLPMGDQTVPRFGYFHADTENIIYSQYWVPLYPQGFYNHNVINHPGFFSGTENNYHHQFIPCDDSWILGNGQEVNHPGFFCGQESNNYHRFMPCDDSWILEAQEEEDLTEEELRVMNSLDQDVVVYDSTYDDEDSLSEETVCRHHAGCIRDWLMHKNCCPLCNATGIRLFTKNSPLNFLSITFFNFSVSIVQRTTAGPNYSVLYD